MDCWHCRRTAVGLCRFCGRGVCEDHVETHPYILETYRADGVTKALVVEDALFCCQWPWCSRGVGTIFERGKVELVERHNI